MISIWSAKNFTPLSWFSTGQQGAWYDPSDLTTLYQDSAGTTPVTAVEQPVGKMLDKSGRGNHAIQATAGNRPTLSARVNLVLNSNTFNASNGTTATLNATISPDGTQNASLITEDTATSEHYALDRVIAITAGSTYTWSFYAKQGVGNRKIMLRVATAASASVVFDLTTGTPSPATATNLVSYDFQQLSNGWWKFWIVFTGASTSNCVCRAQLFNASGGTVYTGDGTSGIYLWGADLRSTNAGALLPVYQRVNTETDYDTVGFPLYLKCNGASSAMATNSIDFTATNQMTVVSGLRKLSDAGQGILSELSATSAINNGSFTLSAPAGASANYSWLSKGTVADTITSGTFTAPITNVISGLSSIGAPSNAMRINGAVQSANSNSEGTGNYGNYPLYLFARAGTSSFFNGQFYGAVIVGQTKTTQQIQQAERYMATKTGISF